VAEIKQIFYHYFKKDVDCGITRAYTIYMLLKKTA